MFNEAEFLYATLYGQKLTQFVELDIHPIAQSTCPQPALVLTKPVVFPQPDGPTPCLLLLNPITVHPLATHPLQYNPDPQDSHLQHNTTSLQQPLAASSQPAAPSVPSHPMRTDPFSSHADGTRKPMSWNDGSIWYPLPHALSVSISVDELTCFTLANRNPE